MSAWETAGKSDEWYTPRYIFDALVLRFDMDVAAPESGPRHVPTSRWLWDDSLSCVWDGCVWMNPPFGGRNGLAPWLDKFFEHRNGVALTSDRTSALWWQSAFARCDAALFVGHKVKFERPDGTIGAQPSTGTTLFASGLRGVRALYHAREKGLGLVAVRP